jgi:outer membrane biosynthesis protein TonB
VYLRATITEQGAVQQITVMGTPNKGAGEASVAAVSGWRFKPAIDSGGKPFAVRTNISLDLTQPGALR